MFRPLDTWLSSLSSIELGRLSASPLCDPDMLLHLQEEITRREGASALDPHDDDLARPTSGTARRSAGPSFLKRASGYLSETVV